MTTDLFVQLERVLQPNERLQLTIERVAGVLVVLLEPVLTEATEDLAPEVAQARAYLSTPLRLRGTGASIDAQFAQRVQGYAQLRESLSTEAATLEQRLSEAVKETRAKVHEAKGRTSKTDEAKRKSDPEPKNPPVEKPAATTPHTSSAATAPTEEKPLSLFE